MRNSKWLASLLCLIGVSASAADITIEPVAVSLSTGRDSVPGRPAPFVFRGLSTVDAPVINAQGDVVFTAFSASQFSSSSGGAFGLYLHQQGQPLRVLADSTLDANGNPVFPVPGQPVGTFFLSSAFGPPLLNDAGDVVFRGRWRDPAAAFTGEGFYAINTAPGSPLVKIVDNTDSVPGHTTGQFFNFQFVAPNPSRMAISLNDNGQVVYWAQFCLEAICTSSNMKNGLFGSTVAGGSGLLLVDSTKKICPTGNPLGVTCDPTLDEGFWEIRPEKGITNNGDVIFHGKIRRGGSSCCGGVFSMPVTGGTITTAAFRTQPAPPDGTGIYSDRFDEVAHNEAGTVLFLPRLGFSSPARFGVYAGDLTGGPHTRITDTIPGSGVVVPGDPPDGQFNAVVFPAMNNTGQMGFRGVSSNSVDSNNHGIYAADASDGTIRLVVDEATGVPGLPAPAKFTSFQESGGTAINEAGNLAFFGIGLDDQGVLFRGIYFYDTCTQETTRIADSSTALTDLGATFGSTGGFNIYTAGAARAGQYDSMNDSNQVAFVAQFGGIDFGIYIATIDSTGGGGAVSITCPNDATVDCPADTSTAALGEASASGCGSITVGSADSSVAGCGNTETITRTWTADNGAGATASCVQTITVVDTTTPSLVDVPVDDNVACDAVPAAASVTATDDCDDSPTVTFAELRIDGSCPNNYTLIRTWTATDACGNVATADQAIGVADTVAPVITCPPDALGLECPADTSVAARGTASATDNCGGVTITSSDVSVPGPGATESITRTWTATDDCGHSASCDQVIEVVDTTAPVVTCAVTTGVLWSPDHNLVSVGLTTNVDDGCDDLTAEGSLTVQVWSDETEIPDTGDGTGRHAPDAKEIDTALRLRNERRGGEQGRVYLIIARAEDGSGNVSFGTCTVVVPRDQSAEGESIVATEAGAAEATVASTPGSTIAEKVAALIVQGWTQHGLSGELGPKQ